METKNGQISYHIPKEYLHMIEGKIKKNQAYVWDEHTSDDVLERLKGK
jgi:hypothetical protein